MNKFTRKPCQCGCYQFDQPTGDPNCWTAPEHIGVALMMRRVRGVLQITPHSIFKYSEENPPAWLRGNVRRIR